MYKRREFNQRRIRTFDPSRIVSQNGRTGQPEEKYVPVHKFSDFALHQQLKQNVTTKGFSEPTPIQDQVIPALLAGKDVTGIAATGTGKTAAFLLPLINKVFANNSSMTGTHFIRNIVLFFYSIKVIHICWLNLKARILVRKL